jgi:uncharacterized integral membrane protein (TIGR00697 family)
MTMSDRSTSDTYRFGTVALAVLFGSSLAVANILAAKLAWFDLPVVGGVALPAGFVAIGVAYLCSDLLVEFEGEGYARDVVNGTLASLVAILALVELSIRMQPAPFYQGQQAFAAVLGSSTSIVVASVITIGISQHVDVRVFGALRDRTGDRHKWLRNIGSTSISQALDTVLFITLAFSVLPGVMGGDPQPLGQLGSIILGQYLVKLIVALLDTPVFYLATSVRERREKPEARA